MGSSGWPLAQGLLSALGGGRAHLPPGWSQSVLSPAGPVAHIQLSLIELSFWIMVGVFAVVAGVLTYILVRFRARKGDTSIPAQVEGNHKLEILWTVVPVILLAILAVPTVRDAFALGELPPPSKSLRVNVIAHQFWWEFDYPDLGIVTADELHIPVGTKVSLRLTSADVIHSFWVPRLAGKTDVIPNRTNWMWIEASEPGLYPGQCAQLCGAGHANMRFAVVAESPARFRAWVAAMKHPQSQPTNSLAAKGYRLFGSLSCSACHAIGGTPFRGTVGPNLTDLRDRRFIAADNLPNTPGNLALYLRNPGQAIPGNPMPNLHLSSSDVAALVAYLRDLR